VSCKRQIDASRFFCQSEISVARHVVVDLDEIVPARFEVLRQRASFVTCPRFIERRHAIGDACLAVHSPTGERQYARTGERPCSGCGLQLTKAREECGVTWSAHNANASHSMRREQRQLEQHRIPAEADVGMHIPQAWDEKLASAVDDSRRIREACLRRRPNADNAVALDQHGEVREQSSPLDVYNSDTRDREIGFNDGPSRRGSTASKEPGNAQRDDPEFHSGVFHWRTSVWSGVDGMPSGLRLRWIRVSAADSSRTMGLPNGLAATPHGAAELTGQRLPSAQLVLPDELLTVCRLVQAEYVVAPDLKNREVRWHADLC